MVYQKVRKKMIERLKNNPGLTGNARVIPNVVFSEQYGLTMQVLVPWAAAAKIQSDFPAIVFLQGSAWKFPDVYFELPQLSALARAGYVVATITHRNYRDGYPMPAFLEDAKTAIRFLRTHAAEYGIDPERIGFWGTSSGGNTAQLVSLTGDDPQYKTREWSEASDSVRCAVSCFGPTDLVSLFEGLKQNGQEGEVDLDLMLGGKFADQQELVKAMSPLQIISERKTDCPLLLLHGTGDGLVPDEQSLVMYEALQAAGVATELILVEEADHEADFWSAAVYEKIQQFFDRHLK